MTCGPEEQHSTPSTDLIHEPRLSLPSRSPDSRASGHGCFRNTSHLTHSTLRANPFPEVTDLFCRLPLPTFFYRLEAIHLGDLMRLSVRSGVKISHFRLRRWQQGRSRESSLSLPPTQPSMLFETCTRLCNFHGLSRGHRTPQDARCFFQP